MAQMDLTQGNITKTLLKFAFPMICGNLLQQLYNVVDTLIVGQFLGAGALAAVGSAYTLMTFLTSILLGMCMGSGALFSIRYGEGNSRRLQEDMFVSFVLIASVTVVINTGVFVFLDGIMGLLLVPGDIYGLMRDYLAVIFWGIGGTFFYNYYASLLRAVGNSVVPLIFLGISALINIVLDLYFVVSCGWGVEGAALATILAQWFSGLGLLLYKKLKCPQLKVEKRQMHMRMETVREVTGASVLTCLQQSVMNLGILMVQGLVNSFGASVMAAFAAAVKIDSFAYMPLQDFGNAFSTFIAQNHGAKKNDRIREGIRCAVRTAVIFALCVSTVVVVFARFFLLIFIRPEETEILAIGLSYLRVVGPFYAGIGLLFLLYGLYRAIERPAMSLVLTVISLGTRVALAYLLSAVPAIGVLGIWWAVPIGWALADVFGVAYYRSIQRKEGRG